MSSRSYRGIKAAIGLLIASVVVVAVLQIRQQGLPDQPRAKPGVNSGVAAEGRGAAISKAGRAEGGSRIDARIGDLDTTSIMMAARASQRARALDSATSEGDQVFVEQRASWLGVRALSARYVWRQAGEATKTPGRAPAAVRSGTIDFVITPLGAEAVASRYFKVAARVTDDELGVTMYKDNVWNPDEPVRWQYVKEGTTGNIDQAAIEGRFDSVCSLYVFEPLNGMSGTYRDSAWDSGPARDENKFREWLGHFSVSVCERPSTPEETATVFHGEPQYLMHLNPMPTGRYWVSQENREIRRFEQEGYAGKGSVFAAEYSSYVRSEDGKAAFPTRFACSYKYPAGHPAAGRECGSTLELSDVRINVPVELSLLQGETR